MKLKFLLFVLIVSISACGYFDIPEPDAYLRQQVIFSAQTAEAQNLGVFVGNVDSYWTPTESNINAMFVALIQYLEATRETEIRENYDSYQHQHFGYIMDGQQYIYGNYFCDSFGVDWRNTFVAVDDGGSCFFQAIYDVSANEITQVYINGTA